MFVVANLCTIDMSTRFFTVGNRTIKLGVFTDILVNLFLYHTAYNQGCPFITLFIDDASRIHFLIRWFLQIKH